MLLFSLPTDAKEPQDTLENIIAETALPDGAYRYAPKHCGFEMTFPAKPHTTQRCAPHKKGSEEDCTMRTSYTMVYDVTTTVEVSVTCVPTTLTQYKSYNEEVIRLTLKGMTSRMRMTDHKINTSTDEKNGTRQGSLLGSTKRGLQNALYNAQILVSDNSIMTLEAKLIGPTHNKADKAFGDILASVKSK